jgi:hypothetical protein
MGFNNFRADHFGTVYEGSTLSRNASKAMSR